MNNLKSNFKRNNRINPEYCISSCKKEFDNNHLTWCEKINKENDFRYIHLLNGNLEEKLETLKQIKSNESMQNEERKTCDPVTTC